MSSKPFIADCSITASWFFNDERDEYSDFTLDYCYKFRAVVPFLWKFEVTNTILIAAKRARITSAKIIKTIDFLNSLPINISNFDFPMYEIMNTARANNLTSYDATYLLTAMHERLPITTNDKALIKACHNNGVLLLKENLS
ncbi:PIN domain protein [Rickettsia felis str. Pedreira]|uniref:PIN domain protein n=2 Tax=Rickettsia felis TaxID=42862 RepID=A0A0F3MR25_RICFI|nr:type II toxin-antitoxin system VapC family toxin [Rickettsia felis]AAY61122.1 Toxin of toxin-antitoxin system [Rickettsia felis URRWXCal2]KHO03316.1 toxin of toxin-antitoxin system [Rickettsia felis str. LSU]KHO03998.1 toxin of toxin-antitoxin system [Rickettsia felis]KJV58233.1 PIN domain protein [Rickettsia felis str. Pedreira]MDE8611510.1 type II toxin-antitoxin system VapC family toxin [Rickettsia felis]